MRLRGERERAKVGSEGLRQRLSETSVAVQMQGGCVSAHAAVIATVQAPAICHRAIAMLCSSGACWSMAMLCSSGACWSMAYFLE